MSLNLNLSKVKTSLEPVPAGNYDVVVSKAVMTEAKSSGKPMIAMQYRIIGDEENDGRVLFDNFSLQPQALWKLKLFLQALDWEGLDDDDGFELDPEELVGVELTIAVAQETGKNQQGEPVLRNVVKAYGAGEADDDSLGLEAGAMEFDFGGGDAAKY